MTAILYISNTGYTRKYASLLAEQTGLALYSLQEAARHVGRGEDVLFLGWMCANSIKGYKKAAKHYRLLAVCAVGMAIPSEKYLQDIVHSNHITQCPVFYLQGGFAMERLRGIYRLMMKNMAKTVSTKLQEKQDRTPEDDMMLEMMLHGGDFVSLENLTPVLQWYEAEKHRTTQQT